MGRVLAPFGVKGWVKVDCFTESPANLRNYRRWWLATAGKGAGSAAGAAWSEIVVAESALHGARLVARFEGCDSPEAAVHYRGCEVAVPREALPEARENEFYQADLIGLEVRNLNDERLGVVTEVFSNGAHEILRLSDGSGERLLPYIATVVRAVEIGAGLIRVDWGADW